MVGGRFVNLSGGKFSYNPLQQLLRLKNDTIYEKIPHTPIPQLSKQKNEAFFESFSKNVLTPPPQVFEPKTDTLFQKSFLLLYRKFFRANLNCDFEKIPLTYLD